MNRDSLMALARAAVAVIAGALVIVPPVVCFVLALGWPGVGLIAAGVGAAVVWWRRQTWNGAPRPW